MQVLMWMCVYVYNMHMYMYARGFHTCTMSTITYGETAYHVDGNDNDHSQNHRQTPTDAN